MANRMNRNIDMPYGYDRMQSPAPRYESEALPWVQAGLSGAGLLSSLYGGYQAGQIADQNYELQKAEFERQRRMEEDRIRREEEQERLANTYAAANRADQGEDRLLNRYKDYYRGVGL